MQESQRRRFKLFKVSTVWKVDLRLFWTASSCPDKPPLSEMQDHVCIVSELLVKDTAAGLNICGQFFNACNSFRSTNTMNRRLIIHQRPNGAVMISFDMGNVVQHCIIGASLSVPALIGINVFVGSRVVMMWLTLRMWSSLCLRVLQGHEQWSHAVAAVALLQNNYRRLFTSDGWVSCWNFSLRGSPALHVLCGFTQWLISMLADKKKKVIFFQKSPSVNLGRLMSCVEKKKAVATYCLIGFDSVSKICFIFRSSICFCRFTGKVPQEISTQS